jgi:hypothetical protein
VDDMVKKIITTAVLCAALLLGGYGCMKKIFERLGIQSEETITNELHNK